MALADAVVKVERRKDHSLRTGTLFSTLGKS